MEDRKGIIVRFVIGRSSNHGDSLERAIDSENKQTNDFIILENHIEALEELPKKIKNFFAQASEKWDAEFFAKVNDDVYEPSAQVYDHTKNHEKNNSNNKFQKYLKDAIT